MTPSPATLQISEQPPILDAMQRERVLRIAQSYQSLLGHALVQNDDLLTALWLAPRAIVTHGTEADPVFFYGNRLALQVFEMDFATFTQLPSRFSAEAPLREERARLLERVSRDGYIDDYSGVRIAASGRRFRIEQATVWNLLDAADTVHGQAATFARWTPLGDPTDH